MGLLLSMSNQCCHPFCTTKGLWGLSQMHSFLRRRKISAAHKNKDCSQRRKSYQTGWTCGNSFIAPTWNGVSVCVSLSHHTTLCQLYSSFCTSHVFKKLWLLSLSSWLDQARSWSRLCPSSSLLSQAIKKFANGQNPTKHYQRRSGICYKKTAVSFLTFPICCGVLTHTYFHRAFYVYIVVAYCDTNMKFSPSVLCFISYIYQRQNLHLMD